MKNSSGLKILEFADKLKIRFQIQRRHDTLHNDVQHNDTQENNKNMTLSITAKNVKFRLANSDYAESHNLKLYC
jgi:hypothetical protein